MSVKVPEALPQAPVLTPGAGGVLNWTDATPVDMTDPNSWTLTGDAKGTAEVGYKIQRADVVGPNTPGTFSDIGKALANHTTFTVPASDGTGFYRVVAWNAAGETALERHPGVVHRSGRADERGRDAWDGWWFGEPVVDGSGQRWWVADHGLRDPEEPRDRFAGVDRCRHGRQRHEHDGDGSDPERQLHLPGPRGQRGR